MNATHGPHDGAEHFEHEHHEHQGGRGRGGRGYGRGRNHEHGYGQSAGFPGGFAGGFPTSEAIFGVPLFGGRGGRGGFGGGRKRRARRGDVRHGILLLIAEEPRNGYAIIQELAERSGGSWTPSSGAVYPALSQLEDEGLIEPATEVGPKHFRLTEAGKVEVEALSAQPAPWKQDEEVVDRNNPMFGLAKSVKQAGMALQAVIATGDEQLIAEAREEIDALRRRLHAKLADDGADEDVDS